MPGRDAPREGELILYESREGRVRVEVLYEDDTFWLNQGRIAALFGVTIPTISHHLTEIYASGELSPGGTVRKVRRVQRQGNRDVRRRIDYYNLDANGEVTAEVAKQLAEQQYEVFRVVQDRAFESDFEREVKRIEQSQSPRRKRP